MHAVYLNLLQSKVCNGRLWSVVLWRSRSIWFCLAMCSGTSELKAALHGSIAENFGDYTHGIATSTPLSKPV